MEAHHHVVTMFPFSPYITYVQFSTQPLHRGINVFFFSDTVIVVQRIISKI